MILLLKKEFRLCLHPAALVMLATSALLLVPNYPFGVSFFYMALGIFFICLDGRENHDAAFTLALPVSRREAAVFALLEFTEAGFAVAGLTAEYTEAFYAGWC